MKTENSKKLLSVWSYINSKHDFFTEFNVDCIIHGLYTVVLPEYRNDEIADLLLRFREYVITLMPYLEEIPEEIRICPPKLDVYLIVSPHTRKICEKYDIKPELVHNFSNKYFIINGKSFADRIGDQDSYSTLCAKKIFRNESKL